MDHFPLYASVSGGCESMIGYTADLGKCFRVLCHARISSVPGNSTTCWVIPSREAMPSLDDVGSGMSHA